MSSKDNEKTEIICEFCGEKLMVDPWELLHNDVRGHTACKKLLRKYQRIGIDRRFWILPKFHIEDGNQKAWEITNEFIKNPNGKGIFFFGPAGTGKTHLAVKIAQEIDLKTRLIKMPKLLLQLRANFNTPNSWKNEDIINELASCELLIIDDLGAEKTSDWVEETIYLLIDERYGKMLPTVLTSNYPLSEIAKRVGDRVCSRIVEMCRVVSINTSDKRRTTKPLESGAGL